jgi:hypothetical protein
MERFENIAMSGPAVEEKDLYEFLDRIDENET